MQKFMSVEQQKLLDADSNLHVTISAGTLLAANISGDILKSRLKIDTLKGTVTSLEDKTRLENSTAAK